MEEDNALIPDEKIVNKILLIRGQKVIIDADLAKLYGVSTKRLNEQVKRNINRFPRDFMFQLTGDEKMQVVAFCDHLKKLKYSPSLPYAFTEHGAIMAASVLNSERAVEISVYVVRAFVKQRQMLATHKELAIKLNELESKLSDHDKAILVLMDAIKQLMEPAKPKHNKQIGFVAD